jgi:RNA polymerase sigma-70 factor (family 1)
LLLNEQHSTAIDRIFRKYWQELYDFAYIKTQDADVSEEIVQEVFIHLWEKRQELAIRNLRGYLFISVKNRIIDHFRQKTFARLDSIADIASTASYPIYLEELEIAIEEAIAQLPENSRLVFNLKRFENQTTREISQRLSMPERTVEYHYTQAIRTLKALLGNFFSLLFALTYPGIF